MVDVAIPDIPALTPVPSTAVIPLDNGTDTFIGTAADIVKGGGALMKDGSVAATGDIDHGGHQAKNAGDAGTATALTTLQQVQALIAAAFAATVSSIADFKQSVRLATTTALPASTLVGNILTANANGALPTIDGVAPAVNDRILDKDDGTGSRRVVYTVTSLGSGGTPWVLTRATDFDASAEVTAGATVVVTEGTANGPGNTNGGNVFMLTTPDPITLGTTSLTWSRIGTMLPDGTTLVVSGGVIVRAALTGDVTAPQGSNATTIANGAVSNAKLASDAVTNVKVDAAAAVAGTKISPDFGSQVVRTTGQIVGASSGTPTATSDGGSFESCTTGSGSLRGLCHRQASADANGARVVLQKSRGTHASPAAHNADDHLGSFVARGYDGSTFYDALILRAVGDAAGGTSKRTRFESQLHNGTALVTGETGLQAAAPTTNATLTTVYSIPIAADTQVSIAIRWAGTQQTSSNRAFRETTLAVRRSGSGNVVEYAHTDGISLQKDDATWGDSTQISYALNNTTHAVDITVQGKASINIDWTIDLVWSVR